MFFRSLFTSVALVALATGAHAANTSAEPNADIIVTAKKLDAARESIKPSLGATTYSLSNSAIKALPGGDNQSLNDIILQLPGVAEDGFGQFHVRADHNGLQYRINGAIMPEGIAVFGQALSPRLVDKLDLITGALPAQYGLRSAGIIDITTKTGLKKGATVSLYSGTADTIEPSVELAGGRGGTNWFVSANYRHNALGIENVSASKNAVHDDTDQVNGFGFVEHILSETDRVSLVVGYSNQHFQIPNAVGAAVPGQFSVNGLTSYASEKLDQNQLQTTGFGIFSLLHAAGDLSLQGSGFVRVATLSYRPDVIGELLFNGSAQAANKRDTALGAQLEGAYKIGDGRHTLRSGIIIQHDRAMSNSLTEAFSVTSGASGAVIIGTSPLSLADSNAATALTYSAYLQDEWKLSTAMVFNFGGRFDLHNGVRNENQLSPRANLVWTPNTAFTAHVGYARYFSPPRNDETLTPTLGLYANTTAASPGGATNTSAFAQREHYFDIGLQQKIGRGIILGLDGYYRLFTNLLDDGQFGAPIVQTAFNYAKGRTRGAEISINYAHAGLTAYANLAWAIAQGKGIASGEYNFDPAERAYIDTHYVYLDHDQRWTGSAGAAYKFREGALAGSYASADILYGSGLRTAGAAPSPALAAVPNGAKLPGHAAVNASLGHKFSRLGLDVHVDVTNLFDAIYQLRDGQGIGVGAPQYGARRGVFLGLTKNF